MRFIRRFLMSLPIAVALAPVFYSGSVQAKSLSLAFESVCASGEYPSLGARSGQVEALRDSMERALTTFSPNDDFELFEARTRLFGGNLDWHSSVHNHWALLSIARITNNASLERRLMARITPAALEDERLRLALGNPAGELPYGQAWLLLMLQELARRDVGRTLEAQRLRNQVEQNVLTYLERTRFPEDGERFSRAHTSWLFGYMMLKLSQPSPAVRSRFAQLQSRVEANRLELERQTWNSPAHFLYLPAVLSILDQIALPRTPQLARYAAQASEPPRLPMKSSNAHQAGAWMVSIWPHASQSFRKDRASCEIFNRGLNAIFAQPEYWENSVNQPSTFITVGHWVPQFMWMGIALEQGAL